MKCTYQTRSGLTFEVEGTDEKEVIQQLAKIQEVFGNDTCGACKKTNVRFVYRKSGKYKYYEVQCQDCKCKLAFGQLEEDTSPFPKRRDHKTKEWLANNGWVKYVKAEDGEESPAPAAPAKAKK